MQVRKRVQENLEDIAWKYMLMNAINEKKLLMLVLVREMARYLLFLFAAEDNHQNFIV